MQTISPTPRTLQAGFCPTERGSFTYSECDIFKYWHTFTFIVGRHWLCICLSLMHKEFKDTKGVIRFCRSKDKQDNGQWKTAKMTHYRWRCLQLYCLFTFDLKIRVFFQYVLLIFVIFDAKKIIVELSLGFIPSSTIYEHV